MFSLLWPLKQIGGPGSIGFLAVCCVIGLVLSRGGRRSRRFARAWLLLVFTVYVLGALPLIANAIEDGLAPSVPAASLSDLNGVDLLIVLSGDNARGRARENRRIIDAVGPRCVVVSGSSWFVDLIVEAGVSRDRIRLDETASTTREQIAKIPHWIAGCEGAARAALIASRLQMPRVAALTSAAGLQVLLAPSAVDDEPAKSGIRLFVPSYLALRVSRDAFYEHLAIAYYRRNQWIR